MKKIFLLLSLSFLIASPGIAQTFKDLKEKASNKIGTKGANLTEDEVGQGLKEALNKGVEKGVEQLSKTDGYLKDPQIKIPLPEEAKMVEEKLRAIGQGEKVDEAIVSMNRAAEDAASLAKDLFIAAIRNMTLQDAMKILRGDDDAATNYLKSSTRAELTLRFQPIIKASLDKVGATQHWNTVFLTYNKIPLVKKVDPDLEAYVTNKAIDGLFIQVAKEEKAIRNNPGARSSELLKKVFSNQ